MTSPNDAKRLRALVKREDNKFCADCGCREPRWASANLGVFICLSCSGIHRNLGVHISFVRSVNLDAWKTEQVDKMEQVGNARAKAFYMANVPPNIKIPNEFSSVREMELWIRDKYEHKRFVSKGPPPGSKKVELSKPTNKKTTTKRDSDVKNISKPKKREIKKEPQVDLLSFSTKEDVKPISQTLKNDSFFGDFQCASAPEVESFGDFQSSINDEMRSEPINFFDKNASKTTDNIEKTNSILNLFNCVDNNSVKGGMNVQNGNNFHGMPQHNSYPSNLQVKAQQNGNNVYYASQPSNMHEMYSSDYQNFMNRNGMGQKGSYTGRTDGPLLRPIEFNPSNGSNFPNSIGNKAPQVMPQEASQKNNSLFAEFSLLNS